MKLYMNFGIGDETSLRAGSIPFPVEIRGANISEKAYGDKDVMWVAFKEIKGTRNCSYGLIGSEVYEPFMKDMGVTKVKDLVGKVLTGFTHSDEGMLIGVSPSN